MKKKQLFLSMLFVGCFMFSANAQTQRDKAKISESANMAHSDSLKASFESRNTKSEAEVEKYLKKHPHAKRTFIKNGTKYYLQRMGFNGKPLYIKTKVN